MGGIQYTSSQGDKAKLEAARSKITNAITGLIVLLLLWLILQVLNLIFGVNIGGFGLPGTRPPVPTAPPGTTPTMPPLDYCYTPHFTSITATCNGVGGQDIDVVWDDINPNGVIYRIMFDNEPSFSPPVNIDAYPPQKFYGLHGAGMWDYWIRVRVENGNGLCISPGAWSDLGMVGNSCAGPTVTPVPTGVSCVSSCPDEDGYSWPVMWDSCYCSYTGGITPGVPTLPPFWHDNFATGQSCNDVCSGDYDNCLGVYGNRMGYGYPNQAWDCISNMCTLVPANCSTVMVNR